MLTTVSRICYFVVLVPVWFATATVALSQSYDDQVRSILELFDAGKTDTAYTLIEPLKRSARFVPSVLYARAYMTQDDRALPLYKEAIALDPGGAWADRSCFALVVRYVDKGDSAAAATWLSILRSNYPRSSLVARATELVETKKDWIAFDNGLNPAADRRRNNERPKRSEMRRSGDSARAQESGSSSRMRGFALQVGLLPTRESAEQRAAQVRSSGLNPSVYPKLVSGKKNYAVVVGPYDTIAEANRHRTDVSKACNCKAFTVRVE